MKSRIDNENNPLLIYAADARLDRKLRAYLKSCLPAEGEDGKKTDGRFPNFAGFCAALGCGRQALEGLRRERPEVYDHIAAVLEDEALNSNRSPAIVNAYIKENFGGLREALDAGRGDAESGGVLRVIVDHDLLEDGA